MICYTYFISEDFGELHQFIMIGVQLQVDKRRIMNLGVAKRVFLKTGFHYRDVFITPERSAQLISLKTAFTVIRFGSASEFFSGICIRGEFKTDLIQLIKRNLTASAVGIFLTYSAITDNEQCKI